MCRNTEIAIVFAVVISIINASIGNGAVHYAQSCSETDVRAAVNLAAEGATVVVPAGVCKWSTTIILQKRITLKGSGPASTVIEAPSNIILLSSLILTNNDTVITGFNFKGTPPSVAILICGKGWRISGNQFESTSQDAKIEAVQARGFSLSPGPSGLVDNNIMINAGVNVIGSAELLNSGDTQNQLMADPLDLGGSSAVYIEDNVFTLKARGNCIDSNYAGSYVARYNRISATGGGYIIEAHSMQSDINRSIKKWEVYNNYLSGSAKYAPFFIRGGTGVVFNNTLSGTFGNEEIHFDNVRSYKDVGGTAGLCDGDSMWDGNKDSTGWPCRDQVGRGKDTIKWDNEPAGSYTQSSMPAYLWNNRNSQGRAMIGAAINNSSMHIKADRDYYHDVMTFDGTSGIGVGILSKRPGVCTPGVAYWATDQGSWNKKVDSLQGVLYKCSENNNWEKYYEPYEYPHPLTKPAPPLKLKISN